eukprot:scaffold327373_cov57-Tisochrysis_lutea.AAC.1
MVSYSSAAHMGDSFMVVVLDIVLHGRSEVADSCPFLSLASSAASSLERMAPSSSRCCSSASRPRPISVAVLTRGVEALELVVGRVASILGVTGRATDSLAPWRGTALADAAPRGVVARCLGTNDAVTTDEPLEAATSAELIIAVVGRGVTGRDDGGGCGTIAFNL